MTTKKTLFDHLNAIYDDQSVEYWGSVSTEDQKTYSPYMINRLLSMNLDQLELVNFFQRFWNVTDNRLSYLFYSQFLPYGKQWNKYVKGKKEKAQDNWLLDLVKDHYKISRREAQEYVAMMRETDAGKEALKTLLEMYGTDPKKVRKATK